MSWDVSEESDGYPQAVYIYVWTEELGVDEIIHRRSSRSPSRHSGARGRWFESAAMVFPNSHRMEGRGVVAPQPMIAVLEGARIRSLHSAPWRVRERRNGGSPYRCGGWTSIERFRGIYCIETKPATVSLCPVA